MNNKLFILDGHGAIFRSYYAYFRNPLTNKNNENTSAIFGFFQVIKKIFTHYKPMYFLVALDSRGDTFRTQIYPEYKANRDKAPEDLISQIPIIIDMLKQLEIPHMSIDSMEADDIIASLVAQAKQQKIPTTIISSDKDLFQLMDEHVTILRPRSASSEWQHINIKWLEKEWQLRPEQVQDYLAIMGDSSDNIPGIKGLGEKSARALLKEYQSLKNIYANIDTIKDTWRKKLYENKDIGMLSYELVGLKQDLPIPNMTELLYNEVEWQKAHDMFAEQNIYAFSKKSKSSSKLDAPSKDETKEIGKSQSSDSEQGSTTSENTKSEVVYRTIQHKAHNYCPIFTLKELNATIAEICKVGLVALDTETDSLDTFMAKPVGISICCKPSLAWYIPIDYPRNNVSKKQPTQPSNLKPENNAIQDPQLTADEIKTALRPLFDGSITIIMHNAKFDLAVLQNWGIDISAVLHPPQNTPSTSNKDNGMSSPTLFDTKIASWLCMPEIYSYTMDSLSKQLLNYEPISFGSLRDDENNPVSQFSHVPLPQAIEYAAEDADITLQLFQHLSKQLHTLKLKDLFFDLEMPLLCILYDIEKIGLRFDASLMHTLSSQLASALASQEEAIYALCEEEFNINSPKQLQVILFEKLKLTPLKKNKTGYSTDLSVLEHLSLFHPVPEKILVYRHLSKLKSTYTDSLPKLMHEDSQRIHTSLNQTGTETGRISSNDPNLQNIPVKDEWGKKIRSAFIASPNMVLVSADYAQIELVVLAHLSEDENMIEAFKNNVDIHTRTASILFKMDEDKVKSEQRRIAKSINFGVIYGMSAFRLANELKIPQKEAREFIEAYFTEFSGVTTFISNTIEQTRELGYTRTILGHRRPQPHINSRNANLRKEAERKSVNTIIQGSAADIVKLAMLEVSKKIQEKKLQSKIILQIHDELLLECPESESNTVITLLKETMEHAYTLSIPLKVSVSSGNNWGLLK